MIISSFVFVFIGFLALIIAMKRHFSQIQPLRNKLTRLQISACRIVGSLCLMASCIVCTRAQGVPIGLVNWTGLLTIAALLHAMLLGYCPQWIIRCGSAVLMLGVVSSIEAGQWF